MAPEPEIYCARAGREREDSPSKRLRLGMHGWFVCRISHVKGMISSRRTACFPARLLGILPCSPTHIHSAPAPQRSTTWVGPPSAVILHPRGIFEAPSRPRTIQLELAARTHARVPSLAPSTPQAGRPPASRSSMPISRLSGQSRT